MITTITINPSLDKTYIIENFKPYDMNRASNIVYNAGSKGINVSRVLCQLGTDTMALGFVGGMYGDILLNHLSGEGIREDFVRVGGGTRINVKIVDPVSMGVTEINEMGEAVTDSELYALFDRIEGWLPRSDAMVLSGSILPEMKTTVYTNIAKKAKAAGVPLFMDCGGTLLRDGMRGSPYCVKCNLEEFTEMHGGEIPNDAALVRVCRELMAQRDIACIVVTMGRGGAVGVTADEAYKVIPPNAAVSSTIGAGDAFMAGMTYAFIGKHNFQRQLAFGTSCATAKVAKEANNIPSLLELLGYMDGVICETIQVERDAESNPKETGIL